MITLTFLTSSSALADIVTIDVQAYIDGYDQLIISNNTLQWRHYDMDAVGRHDGLNEPTIISTTLNGNVVMDQVNWIPEWPEDPPAPIRYAASSSVFTDLIPNIPSSNMIISDVTLIPIRCRSGGQIILEEFNTESITLYFNDYWPDGADWYEARIDVTITPEPATLLLLGFGGMVLRKRRV
jgi:hypothetical protein